MKIMKLSFDDMKVNCKNIITQIESTNWRPNTIVGITRGGALPAVMLSQYFNTPMVSLKISLRNNTLLQERNIDLPLSAASGSNILIVDDINDTGATINYIVDQWNGIASGIDWNKNVRFAVVIDNITSDTGNIIKYVGTTIDKSIENMWVEFCYENWW